MIQGANLLIGANGNQNDVNNPWHGYIDEVRLWNRVLEEKEISTYMKMGAKEALAVNAETKLSVVWANIRTRF